MRAFGSIPATETHPICFYDTGNVDVSVSDTDIATITDLPSKYRILSAFVCDQTGNTDTASLALRTGSGGGGTALISPVLLTGVVTSDDIQTLSLAVDKIQSVATLYWRIAAASTGAATVRLILEIIDLS